VAIVLELLRILLTWPVAAVVIVFGMSYRFRDAIDTFIRTRAFSLKLPGGTELKAEASQPQTLERNPEAAPESPDLASDPTPPHAATNAETPFDATRYESFLQYVDQTLAWKTKSLLIWMNQYSGLTPEAFDEMVDAISMSSEERTAIYTLLRKFNLIAETPGLVQVAINGSNYLGWRSRQHVPAVRPIDEMIRGVQLLRSKGS
jgi:hypothetical protein